MTQLEDRRPVAATTAASAHPNTIADDLAGLLIEHPDLELASLRFIPNEDGTVGIAGRIGALAGVGCPQCHQPLGREHTEYCTLDPGKVWDGVLPDAAKCPTCNGSVWINGQWIAQRETVGMVCPRCGTDYGQR